MGEQKAGRESGGREGRDVEIAYLRCENPDCDVGRGAPINPDGIEMREAACQGCGMLMTLFMDEDVLRRLRDERVEGHRGDEVDVFAGAMRERLAANDHKGGWQYCHPGTLLNRAMGELEELHKELFPPHERDPGAILREAADAANYAMMVADVLGGLASTPEAETHAAD